MIEYNVCQCGREKREDKQSCDDCEKRESSCSSPSACSAVQCIAAYLREHGYDGLYSDECGCLAADLAPCGNMSMSHCFAGYSDRHEAKRQGCDFWITPIQSNAGLHRTSEAQHNEKG